MSISLATAVKLLGLECRLAKAVSPIVLYNNSLYHLQCDVTVHGLLLLFHINNPLLPLLPPKSIIQMYYIYDCNQLFEYFKMASCEFMFSVVPEV